MKAVRRRVRLSNSEDEDDPHTFIYIEKNQRERGETNKQKKEYQSLSPIALPEYSLHIPRRIHNSCQTGFRESDKCLSFDLNARTRDTDQNTW